MSLLRGMKDGAAERIENARAVRPFDSVKALARRAQLDRKDRHVLADANAPASLAGNRSEALWQSVVADPDKAMPAVVAVGDETPELGAPKEVHDFVADYRSAGLALGRHPLELPRRQLLANRLTPALTLRGYRSAAGATADPPNGTALVRARR
jgi:error-prone DNA polymerase